MSNNILKTINDVYAIYEAKKGEVINGIKVKSGRPKAPEGHSYSKGSFVGEDGQVYDKDGKKTEPKKKKVKGEKKAKEKTQAQTDREALIKHAENMGKGMADDKKKRLDAIEAIRIKDRKKDESMFNYNETIIDNLVEEFNKEKKLYSRITETEDNLGYCSGTCGKQFEEYDHVVDENGDDVDDKDEWQNDGHYHHHCLEDEDY